MKKLGKFILILVVTCVVLLLALVLTLPLTIGPLVKQAAAIGGPKALGVPVAVGDVKFNPLGGALAIKDVKVGNPAGYSDKNAFAVDLIEVKLDVKSLTSDTIVINKIAIDAPEILYESKKGESNFDKIKSFAQQSASDKPAREEKQRDKGEKAPGRQVVIEEFNLNNAKIAYASGMTLGKAVSLPLPSLTINDIGKKSGGTSPAEALTEIINAVLGGITKVVTGSAGAAGDLLKGVGGEAQDALKSAGKLLDSAGGSARDATKEAGAAAKEAVGDVGAMASEGVKALGDGAKDAKDAAVDAAKEATDKLKKLNLFKK